MPTRQPDMKCVSREVGSVTRSDLYIAMERMSIENPTHVRPPESIARRMWVPLTLGIHMMNSVCCHPGDRPAFECECSTEGQKIFDPFRCLEASVSQQSVIANPNPQASRHPPHHNNYNTTHTAGS